MGKILGVISYELLLRSWTDTPLPLSRGELLLHCVWRLRSMLFGLRCAYGNTFNLKQGRFIQHIRTFINITRHFEMPKVNKLTANRIAVGHICLTCMRMNYHILKAGYEIHRKIVDELVPDNDVMEPGVCTQDIAFADRIIILVIQANPFSLVKSIQYFSIHIFGFKVKKYGSEKRIYTAL